MDKMGVVIMEKDIETGFLNKELGSYTLRYDMNMIDRIFAVQESEQKIVNMYMTIFGEFEDWEFNAILDNYNTEKFNSIVISIEEDEDSYNPAFLVRFIFEENDSVMEEKINEILSIHNDEMNRVLTAIKDLENEYKTI